MRVCKTCLISKPSTSEFFYLEKNSRTGHIFWRSSCILCRKLSMLKWRQNNRQKCIQDNQKWRQLNPEKLRTYQQLYSEKNKVTINKKKMERRNSNVKYFRQKETLYYSKKYNSDIQYTLSFKLRNRLRSAIKRNQKAGSAIKDLGCSIEFLKTHLESKFQSGMTWDNYGRTGWHIDHIKPLSSFDLSKRNEFKIACHYTNLQPLWAYENLSKGAKIYEGV